MPSSQRKNISIGFAKRSTRSTLPQPLTSRSMSVPSRQSTLLQPSTIVFFVSGPAPAEDKERRPPPLDRLAAKKGPMATHVRKQASKLQHVTGCFLLGFAFAAMFSCVTPQAVLPQILRALPHDKSAHLPVTKPALHQTYTEENKSRPPSRCFCRGQMQDQKAFHSYFSRSVQRTFRTTLTYVSVLAAAIPQDIETSSVERGMPAW